MIANEEERFKWEKITKVSGKASHMK